MSVLDPYHNNARVTPLLLVLFPPALAIALWLPSAMKWTSGLTTGAMAVALSFFGAQVTRHVGKSKEQALRQMWDGRPTVRFLRHRNKEFNALSRAKCHANLQARFPDLKLPTAQEEQADPRQADQVYEACVTRLIHLTRDASKHALLHKENMAFGFLRNLWGLKTVGIAAAVVTALAAVAKLWIRWRTTGAIKLTGEEFTWVTFVVSAFALTLWVFWARPDKIKVPDEGYARHLLEFCEQMDTPQTSPSTATAP